VFRRLCLLLPLALAPMATAETRWCKITGKDASDTIVYPPVAHSAHLVGDVQILLTFNPNGEILEASTTNGTNLLADLTKLQLLKWHLKTDATGSAPCQNIVSVTYELVDDHTSTETSTTFAPTMIRVHVKATVPTIEVMTNDPVSKRKRFWIF
jgi:hypothetical protein